MTRGIFDTVPGSPGAAASSPFTAVQEPAVATQAPAARSSPFTVVEEEEERPDGFRPAKIPEKRKAESPFQIAEPSEGFGAIPAAPSSPFEAAFPPHPFQAAPQQAPAPAYAPQPAASPFAAAGPSPYGQGFASPYEAAPQPQAYAPQPPAPQPVAQPQPQARPAPEPSYELTSDSSSIRQLELRAIFGVDREMGVDEILQRCRALPGIRNVARLGSEEFGTIESLKSMMARLGFGGGALRIYSGSIPVEFIRERTVLLAVQTDGGFAPGVRETLMIAARELARLV